MGIIKSGILGPIQNGTGAIVTKIYRGQNVITGRYRKSGKHKKPTSAQREVREKLKALNSYLLTIADVIDAGFKKRDKKHTAINAALQYNYEHAFIVNEEQVEINYPAIVYSIGNVEPPESPVLSSSNGKIHISWYDMPQSKYCQYGDLGTVLLVNTKTKNDIGYRGICKRGDLQVSINVSFTVGSEYYCFMNFDAPDGKTQGKSIYLGTVIVAAV